MCARFVDAKIAAKDESHGKASHSYERRRCIDENEFKQAILK